jgi:hypothetical protein
MTELKGKWFTVQIPDNDNNKETMWEAQDKLRSLGVYFDTGYAFTEEPYRDWEIDWSLEGGTPEQVINVLKEFKIDYRMVNVRDPDPEIIAQLEEE